MRSKNNADSGLGSAIVVSDGKRRVSVSAAGRVISCLLLFCILFGCLLSAGLTASAAAQKQDKPRSIAIVFDNSGSMYMSNKTDWCRATYAMEVFAAMLNDTDALRIYPMHPVEAENKSYSMDSPISLTGSGQAGIIRDIFTPDAQGTPIETVVKAYEGLKNASGEKWLIVLTDGDSFYENDKDLGGAKTLSKLNELFSQYSSELNVLYLGVGGAAIVPNANGGSGYKFFADKASNSADVLSKLTAMCNMIFGRDTIPSSHISNDTINVDVSLKKLIVFVQGENVSGVSIKGVSGQGAGQVKGSYSPRYSEKGAGNYKSVPDNKLQGMMVTYTDCPSGEYKISYSGTASSVEVYYEPDVDMVFTFTDDEGHEVQPDGLYEGDYKITYGMKDAKTGEYTNSDLLGNIEYTGAYYVNGEKHDVKSTQKNGTEAVSLKEGDQFNAEMTVRYLSGYEIHMGGENFGWPLSVASRPAGNIKLELSEGADAYELQSLDKGTPFRAEVFFEGQKLTGEELKKVELTWDPDLSSALLTKETHDDYIAIHLSHKDPAHPENTETGACSVPITAEYKAQGAEVSRSFPEMLSYVIDDTKMRLATEIVLPKGYYQLSEIGEGDPIIVNVTLNGQPLTQEQFNSLEFKADCGGIDFELKEQPDKSAYALYLKKTDGLETGSHAISCEATLKDEIGRQVTATDDTSISIGILPLWARWLIALIIIALLIALIIWILNRKVMPKLYADKAECKMIFDGEPFGTAEFRAGLDSRNKKSNSLKVYARRAGSQYGLKMSVEVNEDSRLKTPRMNRSVNVFPLSVDDGTKKVKEVSIDGIKYVFDEDTKKLTTKETEKFRIGNSTVIKYSGETNENGMTVPFDVVITLTCRKN